MTGKYKYFKSSLYSECIFNYYTLPSPSISVTNLRSCHFQTPLVMFRRLFHILLFQRHRIAFLLLCVFTYLTFKIFMMVLFVNDSSPLLQSILEVDSVTSKRKALIIPPLNIPLKECPLLKQHLGLPRSLQKLNCTDCKQFECHRFLFPEAG